MRSEGLRSLIAEIIILLLVKTSGKEGDIDCVLNRIVIVFETSKINDGVFFFFFFGENKLKKRKTENGTQLMSNTQGRYFRGVEGRERKRE